MRPPPPRALIRRLRLRLLALDKSENAKLLTSLPQVLCLAV